MQTTARHHAPAALTHPAATAAATAAICLATAHAQPLNPAQIEDALLRAAAWQIERRSTFDIDSWFIAPLWDGLLNAAEATGNPAFLGEVIGFGDLASWSLGPGFYHADDHAVGHAWLDIYMADPTRTERLQPTRSRFDAILAAPETRSVRFGGQGPATNRWTWCDALYMAPPTWARLHAITGNDAYLDFMTQEWLYTHTTLDLWSEDHAFFYRDSRFLGSTASNGQPVFWSRGNGWVFAGLAITLDSMPDEHPDRAFYEAIFEEMAESVRNTQIQDGLWTPNLLDPIDPPVGESSGTAFFTFGLTWGINNGLLDLTRYWPTVQLGWEGLLTCQQPSGLVGWVQPAAEGPGSAGPNNTAHYGTGAFLLAGSEILKRIAPQRTRTLAQLLPAAETYTDSYWNRRGESATTVTVLNHSGNDGNVPQNAFDGVADNPDNRWSVFGLDQPKFVEVDLGETLLLRGTVLHTYQQRDYRFTIEVRANEGSPWRLIVDRSTNTESGPIADELPEPVAARLLRLQIDGAATYPGPWVSVQELELVTDRVDRNWTPPPAGITPLRPWPRGCAPADTNADGTVNIFDILEFFTAFADGARSADWTHDGAIDIFDAVTYFGVFANGCG